MQTYEDFEYEITEACGRTQEGDLDVQREIVRILDYYYNLNTIQLMLIIPAVLVRTKREHALEFTLTRINSFFELKTQNFTIKSI